MQNIIGSKFLNGNNMPLRIKNNLLISLLALVVLPTESCFLPGEYCIGDLTAAQCANVDENEYVRTYQYFEGCEPMPGLVEGTSIATWTFNGVDEYKVILEDEETVCAQMSLSEDGFVVHCSNEKTPDSCYDVIYTLRDN